ncbi:MAG: hypothetical protein ABFS28_04470 [Bacteroidota bacterium]
MSVNLCGQEYRSLLENAGWCCEYYTGTGAIYREFYVSESISIVDDLFGTEYLIQEDTEFRRVWYQNNGELELIYDFSLIENDTFNITLHDTITGSYTVTNVDTISTLSGNRVRWILYLNDSISIEEGILDRNLVWIEGIGSTYGPLYPKTIPLEHETWSSGTCLEAAYDSARNQIYQGYCNTIGGFWPEECNFITDHINEKVLESSLAYFNAAGILEIISERRIGRIRIYDISGKQIYECSNSSGEGHLFIPNNFAVGIYICDLYDETNKRSSIKVTKNIKSP